MIPDEDHAKSVLKEYEEIIVNIILDAWKDCWAKHKDLHDFKRTRACIMHQFMMRHAKASFAAKPLVQIIPGHETAYFLIEDRLAIRLKKGDEKHLGRNNKTQMSLAFVTPEAEQTSLPLGLPAVQRLDVTYSLNDLESKIEGISVAGRDGPRRLWHFDIYPRKGEVGVLVEFPSAPTPPPGPENVLSVPDAGSPGKKHG